MLLTIGVLAFGFMLGVHASFAEVFSLLPPPGVAPEYASLQDSYTTWMWRGAAVAIVGLCTAMWLGQRD
jgi:hypothetical protein